MNEFDRLYQKSLLYKKDYPPGTRIELIEMNDPYHPVLPGTRGTVDHVDDGATIHMKWDNGRTLGIVPGEDVFRKLTEQELKDENTQVLNFGDGCKIRVPKEPIDVSRLDFFDDLEYDCWALVEKYSEKLGIKLMPNDEEVPISFDIAKGVQDRIIEMFEETGVVFNFDETQSDDYDEDEAPVMGM